MSTIKVQLYESDPLRYYVNSPEETREMYGWDDEDFAEDGIEVPVEFYERLKKAQEELLALQIQARAYVEARNKKRYG